jgi:tRNA-2-methylthio-N6-dimethylallyladenosine synthase
MVKTQSVEGKKEKNKKKVFIKTFGCQMNVNDSERIKGILLSLGYEFTNDWKEADLILLNTCTVRERPDRKVLAHIGEYKKVKKWNKNAKIGVCGCLAQRMGEELVKRSGGAVDIMFSSYNIHHLPQILQKAEREGKAIEILPEPPPDEWDMFKYPTVRENPYWAFITIMKGCDKDCTYCIVPKTRGRERSRPLESILEEVKSLVKDGVKEIHLLGQNVTAWGKDFEKPIPFSYLLYKIAEIEGVERIRFTTGYPSDLTDDVIKAMGEIPQIADALHLPFQSGSNRILKLMHRYYTKEEYLEKVYKLKEVKPDIAISADVIVGFPGETEEDFLETLDVLEKVRFEQLFSFKYSPRPGTPAAEYPNQVPDEVKTERMHRLLELQKRIMNEEAKRYIGKVVHPLFERYSDGKLIGRDEHNKWVEVVSDRKELLGKIVPVKVEESSVYVLRGKLSV